MTTFDHGGIDVQVIAKPVEMSNCAMVAIVIEYNHAQLLTIDQGMQRLAGIIRICLVAFRSVDFRKAYFDTQIVIRHYDQAVAIEYLCSVHDDSAVFCLGTREQAKAKNQK